MQTKPCSYDFSFTSSIQIYYESTFFSSTVSFSSGILGLAGSFNGTWQQQIGTRHSRTSLSNHVWRAKQFSKFGLIETKKSYKLFQHSLFEKHLVIIFCFVYIEIVLLALKPVGGSVTSKNEKTKQKNNASNENWIRKKRETWSYFFFFACKVKLC